MKHTRRFLVAGVAASVAISATGALAASGNQPAAIELDEVDQRVLSEVTDPADADEDVSVASEPSAPSEPSPVTVEEESVSTPSVEDEVESDELATAEDGAILADDPASPPSDPTPPTPPSAPSEPSPVSEPSPASVEEADEPTPPSEPSPESPESPESVEDEDDLEDAEAGTDGDA